MCGAVIPERVEEQLGIARAASARYFGHLRLASNGKQTDVLLGSESRSKAGLSMVDWRTAPLAEVFFGYGEGEEYGVTIEGRHLDGTVALHRVVALQHRAKKRFRAAVVVPTEGLRRLSRSLLDRLGTPAVEVYLYDKFAAKQARRVFRGLPRRESQSARASVIRFKRHDALRSLLRELPPRAVTSRTDLHELFGDRALVEKMVREAGLPLPTISDLLEHTRIQFSNTTEEEFSGTQASALQTLDGRAIDEGTVREDARTIDVEDYAVLFELDALRGTTARPPRYDRIVVDEAQELAPLELGL